MSTLHDEPVSLTLTPLARMRSSCTVLLHKRSLSADISSSDSSFQRSKQSLRLPSSAITVISAFLPTNIAEIIFTMVTVQIEKGLYCDSDIANFIAITTFYQNNRRVSLNILYILHYL